MQQLVVEAMSSRLGAVRSHPRAGSSRCPKGRRSSFSCGSSCRPAVPGRSRTRGRSVNNQTCLTRPWLAIAICSTTTIVPPHGPFRHAVCHLVPLPASPPTQPSRQNAATFPGPLPSAARRLPDHLRPRDLLQLPPQPHLNTTSPQHPRFTLPPTRTSLSQTSSHPLPQPHHQNQTQLLLQASHTSLPSPTTRSTILQSQLPTLQASAHAMLPVLRRQPPNHPHAHSPPHPPPSPPHYLTPQPKLHSLSYPVSPRYQTHPRARRRGGCLG